MLGQWFLAAILVYVLPYTMAGNKSVTFPFIVIMLLSLLIPMAFAMKKAVTKTEGIAVTIISIPFVIVIMLLVFFLHPIGSF